MEGIVASIGLGGFVTALRAAALIACWLGLSTGLTATPILVGITADSHLVQIDPLSGAGAAYVALDGDYNPLGIAWNGTSLYLYGQNNGDLRQVTDLATGATSEVATPIPGGFIPTKGDLTYNAGSFYVGSTALADGSFDPAHGSLFSVTDGSGYTGSQIDTGAFPKVGGLAFGPDGTFYGLDQFGTTLFTLNATTGGLTTSMPLTGKGLNPNDFTGGLVFGPDGTLYTAQSPDGIYSEWFSISPTTGAAIDIGPIGAYDIVGLALLGAPTVNPPPPSIPEPASFVLIGTGALVLLMLRRKRQNS
jgi:hypothetical protein